MKKNAFTLIELLAVILILGIIALIAIPTVTNIIKESKRGAFKASVQNIIGAVETECQLEQMRGEELTTSYTFTNGSIDNNLNIKGDLPQSGTITVDSSCNVEVDVTDGTFTATKPSDSDAIEIGEAGKQNIPAPVSFAEDSWETIVANVKTGNLSKYNVGDTKEIALTGFTNKEEGSNGLYTIRIANTSTPEECSTEGFSKTACGFVIEFEDIIESTIMNSEMTNVGGWEASELRNYVNTTIYNALPAELKTRIIDTKVVSGHGSIEAANFITTDKLYLLSTKELWGKKAESNVIDFDTAEIETRQLDYYDAIGVTTENFTGAIKKMDGYNYGWWLRTSDSYDAITFCAVSDEIIFDLIDEWTITEDYNGDFQGYTAEYSRGVAPAFRIG